MAGDLPCFNMKSIYRRRDRLFERCVTPRLNERLEGAALQALAGSVRENLPSGISRNTVFESVRYVAGHVLTAKLGMELCWRLAGNTATLKAGQPVLPWTVQRVSEWVPLQILRASPYRNQKGNYGYNYDFRVLAGSPCPMKIQNFWSREIIKLLSTRMGFSRWHDGKYPYHQATELVGLRLLGELDPLRSRVTPVFFEVGVPDSFVNWNREHVLKVRCRVEPCPRGFILPCRQCAVGYTECPAATHCQNYVQRFCLKCGETKWFDLDLTSERCMDCQHKELTRKVD